MQWDASEAFGSEELEKRGLADPIAPYQPIPAHSRIREPRDHAWTNIHYASNYGPIFGPVSHGYVSHGLERTFGPKPVSRRTPRATRGR